MGQGLRCWYGTRLEVLTLTKLKCLHGTRREVFTLGRRERIARYKGLGIFLWQGLSACKGTSLVVLARDKA